MKKTLCIMLAFFNIFILSGCWNYREIDRLAIIGGLAIDKDDIENKYKITVEVYGTETGKGSEGSIKSELYESEGKSIFDAIRNLIIVTGRRAYWSHCKVVIINGSIAEKDISPMLDWLYRDAELRRDVKILLSLKDKAEDILKTDSALENTVSYHLYAMIEAQSGVNKFPNVELWEVVDHINTENKSMLVPTVEVEKDKDRKIASIKGSGILKNGKLIGMLSPDETNYALWLQGKIKNGIFVITHNEKKDCYTTYETFGFKRIVEVSNNKGLSIKVNIKCDVGIAEITSGIDFKEKRNYLADKAQNVMKDRLTMVLKKMQGQYQSDVFELGQKVKIQNKKLWKNMKDNWDEEFANVPIEINVDVKIRGSATVSKPVKEGE